MVKGKGYPDLATLQLSSEIAINFPKSVDIIAPAGFFPTIDRKTEILMPQCEIFRVGGCRSSWTRHSVSL